VLECFWEVSRLRSGTSENRWPDVLRLVAHQLRIPTSLIAGYTEMLASDEIQRDQQRRKEILEEVRQSLRDLNRLAVELQEAGRAASGTLTLRKEPVPVGALIEESVRLATPLCEFRRVDLEPSARAAPAGRVIGDRFYLKMCLVNLIDNAAKYGKPGGTVRIITEPLGPLIEIRVADEGVGLGPRAARLFAPFAQGVHANEGVGLGLALVKTIVEAHAGSVTWRSGKGSYVGFTIPWSPN
jgi:two-component system, chemotaxis family, CheB/CheR fusion protein